MFEIKPQTGGDNEHNDLGQFGLSAQPDKIKLRADLQKQLQEPDRIDVQKEFDKGQLGQVQKDFG